MPTINGKACVANGRNLIIQSDLIDGYIDRDNGNTLPWGDTDVKSDNYIPTNGATVFTFSSPDYAFKGNWLHTLAMYDSNKNYLGYQPITSATQTLSKSNVAYIKFSINFKEEGGTAGQLSDWLSAHRYKLEKGSVATPWTPAPVDKVFSNGVQVYGRNMLTGTSNVQDCTLSGAHWQGGTQSSNGQKISIPGTPGKSYTYSVNVKTATFNCYPEIEFYDSNKKWISNSAPSPMTYIGIRKITATAPANTAFLEVSMVLQNPPDSQTVVFNSEKLELGKIVTPWSPAPEDVM